MTRFSACFLLLVCKLTTLCCALTLTPATRELYHSFAFVEKSSTFHKTHPSVISPCLTSDNIKSSCHVHSRRQYTLLHNGINEQEKVSSAATVTTTTITTAKIEEILSRLTSLFPIFVTSFAILGATNPSTLQWVSNGNLITILLSTVMLGTGMTLTTNDFTSILQNKPTSILVGVLCQFLIMPAMAFLVGKTLLLSHPVNTKRGGGGNNNNNNAFSLFLGLALVGCSPGGTASNLVSLIAKADVALSVLLTSCSTILASLVTPLLVKLLLGMIGSGGVGVGGSIRVSGLVLCQATAKVVLMPVVLGMILNAKLPNMARMISVVAPFASVVLVSLICGGVVAENASSVQLMGGGGGAAAAGQFGRLGLFPTVLLSVVSLHMAGFLLGYCIPKFVLKYKERVARTMSIEVGMQNSALAVVLARSVGGSTLASLPGALSATVHSCLGSVLAGYWRWVDDGSEKGGGVGDYDYGDLSSDMNDAGSVAGESTSQNNDDDDDDDDDDDAMGMEDDEEYIEFLKALKDGKEK